MKESPYMLVHGVAAAARDVQKKADGITKCT
jgi:hypothetical protein